MTEQPDYFALAADLARRQAAQRKPETLTCTSCGGDGRRERQVDMAGVKVYTLGPCDPCNSTGQVRP